LVYEFKEKLNMTTYFDVFIQCPACISEKGYDPTPPGQWYHNNCEGKIQLGDNAYYKCLKCGYSSHVKNWRYSCEKHTDYRPTTAAHFSNAISISGQMTGKAGRQWLLTLLQNLEDW
jgi:hypothetical protein